MSILTIEIPTGSLVQVQLITRTRSGDRAQLIARD